MSLDTGARLGSYEVIAPIGKGGMGEVYRARDTKLDRNVALKVLPDEFAADPERISRFTREAKVLASLNHPHIAGIYGFESGALVLELVEGPTLADRIAQGPLPVDEALAIAKQIAEALEAGHEAGIVHRDLKPANIKVKDDGTVKVLDYGLAKALEGEGSAGSAADFSQSPTLTRQGTEIGVILGTAAYMSPEQAKGKRVDKRSDIWSFGAVLYEMLTGTRAFAGEDVSEIVASVIKSEPDWRRLPSGVSPTVHALLKACLEKDPKRRVRDIGDVRLLLAGAFDRDDGPAAPGANRTSTRGSRWPAAVAGLVAGVLVAVGAWSLRPEPRRPVVRVVARPPASSPLDIAAAGSSLAITPDGSTILYPAIVNGQRRLVARSLDRLEESTLDSYGRNMFLSPDGRWVAYFSDSFQVEKAPIAGGAAVTIATQRMGSPRGGSWGGDGTIVVSSEGRLWKLLPSAEKFEPLTSSASGEGVHRWPEILPGGEAALFSVVHGTPERADVAVVSLRTGQWKTLISGGGGARYAPTGHLVYGVNGTLFAVGFDLARLEVTTDPVALFDGVVTRNNGPSDIAISPSNRSSTRPGHWGRRGIQSCGWIVTDARSRWASTPRSTAPCASRPTAVASPSTNTARTSGSGTSRASRDRGSRPRARTSIPYGAPMDGASSSDPTARIR